MCISCRWSSHIAAQYFTVTLSEGIVASSFKKEQKVYIDPLKLLPLSRFLPQAKGSVTKPARGGSFGRGAPRGWTTAHL